MIKGKSFRQQNTSSGSREIQDLIQRVKKAVASALAILLQFPAKRRTKRKCTKRRSALLLLFLCLIFCKVSLKNHQTVFTSKLSTLLSRKSGPLAHISCCCSSVEQNKVCSVPILLSYSIRLWQKGQSSESIKLSCLSSEREKLWKIQTSHQIWNAKSILQSNTAKNVPQKYHNLRHPLSQQSNCGLIK